MRAICSAVVLAACVAVSTMANATRQFEDSRYEGVNAFLEALSKGERASARDLVAPFENGPGGHLEIPNPDAAIDAVLGCQDYNHKYANGDFPIVLTKWQCGDLHYTLWVRPSYVGQQGMVQIVAFRKYSPLQSDGTAIQPKGRN